MSSGTLSPALGVCRPVSAPNSWIVRLLPSLTDFAFLLPAFLLFYLLPGTRLLLSDGDTGWHIRTGEWILQHHAVPTQDLFSFTKPGASWFAWEWGWDVLFAAIHKVAGLQGVALINVLLLCVTSALLFRLIRRRCNNDLLSLALTVPAMWGSSIHWLARPHVASWIFFLTFGHVLLSAERGKLSSLRFLPFLMVLWTNLHGSFFLGIAMVVFAAVGAALDEFLQPRVNWNRALARSRPYLISALLCTAATFVNPYTWHLHEHIFRYLKDSSQLDRILEFLSVNFHHGPIVFFEAMLLLGLMSAFWWAQRRNWTAVLMILFWAHLSLIAVRNVPMYLFLVTPLAACMIADALERLRIVAWTNPVTGIFREAANEFRPLERIERVHLMSAGGILLLALLFASGRSGFEARLDPQTFPESAIPVVQRSGAQRIFTTDQWGDYLIYRLYPSRRVFEDGRSDFYGSPFLDISDHILSARWDWEAELNRFSVDMVIVTPETPIATVMKNSPHWAVLFDDGHVIAFGARHGAHGLPPHKFQPLRTTEETSLESRLGTQVETQNTKEKKHDQIGT